MAAALTKRLKDQTPAPGAEAPVHRNIEELRTGEPKYELMSPAFADLTRKQLPQIKALIAQFGALESITFKKVGPNGMDVLEVKFEHGSSEWSIMLDSDGKVTLLGFRPL